MCDAVRNDDSGIRVSGNTMSDSIQANSDIRNGDIECSELFLH